MISITTEMVLRAIILSYALGMVSVLFYRVAELCFSHIVRRGLTWGKAYGFLCSLLDATYIIAIGLIHVLISYESCDGVLNIYAFLALFLGMLSANIPLSMCRKMFHKHQKRTKRW